MGEYSIKLLSFWCSPFALRVQLGLELKGLKYEVQEEDLFHQKSELLLQSNPVWQKVPVLIHNGNPICESFIILVYIDETWPNHGPAILPKDPFERAEIRFWADFVEKKFLGTNAVGYRAVTSTGDEKQKALEELKEDWATLEGCLSKKKSRGEEGSFFGGKEMNLVDLALSFVPWYIPAYARAGVEFPSQESCPLLHEWVKAVENSQARHVYPDKQKIADYMDERFEKLASAKNDA